MPALSWTDFPWPHFLARCVSLSMLIAAFLHLHVTLGEALLAAVIVLCTWPRRPPSGTAEAGD